MKKSLTRLDLNLLFILRLLLQERSVSGAAKKLSVTPSAVSKSLGKLRDWFDDPLFINTPQGLQPTPLTLSIEPELIEWLQIGSQILDMHSDEIPKGVKFEFVMESPLMLMNINPLTQRICDHYPEAKIRVRNWDESALAALIRGDADIGFSGRESHPLSKESLHLLPNLLNFEVLFTDVPLVYLRHDHPALQHEWDLANFLSYPHINVIWEQSETWALDDVMKELALQRQVILTLSSFEQALFMAAQPGHQMIATAPRYCEQYIRQLHPELVSRPIPLELQYLNKLAVPFTLIWHKRNAYNPKVKWLKQTIKTLYAPD